MNGTKYFSMGSIMWFTNLDHGRRHQELPLMTAAENLKFSRNLAGKSAYDHYDNYGAIEVATYKEIPRDYDGAMGVPVTFLDKYNPDQFEIMGYEKSYELQTKQYGMQVQVNTAGKRSNVTKLNDGAAIKVDRPPTDETYYIVDGEYYIQQYKRIFIRHRRPTKGKKK